MKVESRQESLGLNHACWW